jgi:hypothetical protein
MLLVRAQPAVLRLALHHLATLIATRRVLFPAALRAQVLRAVAATAVSRSPGMPSVALPGLKRRVPLSMLIRGRKCGRREERKAFESQFMKHGFSSFSQMKRTMKLAS